MSGNTNISNYIFYLNYLAKKLEGFFEQQAPYICCKKGCAKCCRNGEYPFSKIEFDYIMVGFSQLPVDVQIKINEKVKKIKKAKEAAKDNTEFTYECPFLINNECSVYNYRGIICRSFGLMYVNSEGAPKIPFCTFEGLNYSNVIDLKTKIFSSEKFKKLGVEQEPLAYNTAYSFLTSKDIEKNFAIEFGEKKPLIDWFEV